MPHHNAIRVDTSTTTTLEVLERERLEARTFRQLLIPRLLLLTAGATAGASWLQLPPLVGAGFTVVGAGVALAAVGVERRATRRWQAAAIAMTDALGLHPPGGIRPRAR